MPQKNAESAKQGSQRGIQAVFQLTRQVSLVRRMSVSEVVLSAFFAFFRGQFNRRIQGEGFLAWAAFVPMLE